MRRKPCVSWFLFSAKKLLAEGNNEPITRVLIARQGQPGRNDVFPTERATGTVITYFCLLWKPVFQLLKVDIHNHSVELNRITYDWPARQLVFLKWYTHILFRFTYSIQQLFTEHILCVRSTECEDKSHRKKWPGTIHASTEPAV
jgi:hypothetical protein